MIRVAVVDDHPVTSAGVIAALAASGEIEVVGTASTLSAAVGLVAAASPDVVLCDIEIGAERGLDLPARLPEPRPAIVYLTSYDYASYIREAIDAGASGYILKTAPVREIVAAIVSAADGKTTFSSRDVRAARGAPRVPSERERSVIALVAQGMSNAEIGAELAIDERTVESHLRRLFVRYDVESRTALSMLGLREGWIRMTRGT